METERMADVDREKQWRDSKRCLKPSSPPAVGLKIWSARYAALSEAIEMLKAIEMLSNLSDEDKKLLVD
jgi:hypothetical protein